MLETGDKQGNIFNWKKNQYDLEDGSSVCKLRHVGSLSQEEVFLLLIRYNKEEQKEELFASSILAGEKRQLPRMKVKQALDD